MISIVSKKNFIIQLNDTYHSIINHYSKNVLENIKKSKKEALTYDSSFNLLGIPLYEKLYEKKISNISPTDFINFTTLCRHLHSTNNCFTRIVRDKHQNILSSAIFLKDNRRIYNIMNATTIMGRNKEANYFLFDNLLQEFAGSTLVLDFEGSELPGVAAFYQKLGAINQPYFHYHLNKLPGILRWLKK